MRNRAAIEKAIGILRVAGDNDGADDLVLELSEIDSTSDDDATAVVVVEIESAGEEGSGVVTNDPPAGEIEVIEAEAAAAVAVIEAEAAAAVDVMEAAAEIEAAAEERESEEIVEVVADATTDPDPDPEPRTSHPFYRPLFRRQ